MYPLLIGNFNFTGHPVHPMVSLTTILLGPLESSVSLLTPAIRRISPKYLHPVTPTILHCLPHHMKHPHLNGGNPPQHRPTLTARLRQILFSPQSLLLPHPLTLDSLHPSPHALIHSLLLPGIPSPSFVYLYPPAFLIPPLLGASQISLLVNRRDFHLCSDLRLPEGRDQFPLPDSSTVRLWWPEGVGRGRRVRWMARGEQRAG